MNRLKLIPIAILIIVAGSGFGKELPLNSTIPLTDVNMTDISGQELSLNDIQGEEGLLVIFSCNTCPWVKAWDDRYVTIAEEYGPRGIGMVAINSNAKLRDGSESLDAMRQFAKANGYNFYYTVDEQSRLAQAFGATRTPHVYLFDKTGKLVYRGAIDDNARNADKVKEHYLMNALDAMLAGKSIPETETKAFGCTIKFAAK